MKNIVLVFLCILLFTSCKYFRGDHCNNTLPVVGVYENVFDKEAENILIIKEDGTFEQVFRKGEVVKKNKGSWEFFKEHCKINLKELKLLHKLPEPAHKYFIQDGVTRLNNIVFVEGMSLEFNYYRVKN